MSASSVAIASRGPAGRAAAGWRRRWAISSSRCASAASSCSTSVVVEGGARRVSLRAVATTLKHARRIASMLLVTCHRSEEDSTGTPPTLATSGQFFHIHSAYPRYVNETRSRRPRGRMHPRPRRTRCGFALECLTRARYGRRAADWWRPYATAKRPSLRRSSRAFAGGSRTAPSGRPKTNPREEE